MQPWTIGRRRVVGSPSRIREIVVAAIPELLQSATDSEPAPPAGDGGVQLRLYGRVGGVSGHKVVTAHVGEVKTTKTNLTVPLRWEATAGRWFFPSFEGQLEFEETGAASVELVVAGRYVPPLGPVGAVADVLGGASVAQGTAQWLAERLAKAISDRLYGTTEPVGTDSVAMTVRQIMSRDSLVFDEDMPLRSGASLLLRGRISGAPVVDQDGRVIGVLSERDLLEKAGRPPWFGWRPSDAERRATATTVGQACTRPALTTEADTPVRDAAAYMAAHDVDRLVVMDGARHVGIVTRSDVLRVLVRDQDQIEDLVHDIVTAEGGDDEVEIDLADGVVTLRGKVAYRSQRDRLFDAVVAVDGIIDVEADQLLFRTDDLVPPPMPLL